MRNINAVLILLCLLVTFPVASVEARQWCEPSSCAEMVFDGSVQGQGFIRPITEDGRFEVMSSPVAKVYVTFFSDGPFVVNGYRARRIDHDWYMLSFETWTGPTSVDGFNVWLSDRTTEVRPYINLMQYRVLPVRLFGFYDVR